MGMFLPYFEPAAFDRLQNDIPTNSEKYEKGIAWLSEYFAEEKYITESTIEVPTVTLNFSKKSLSKEAQNSEDFLNSQILHSSYRGVITPQLATNKYLWTALAHSTFNEYVSCRWGKNDIKARFFCTGGRQSLNYYNAISRLWWAGELTYDEKRKYELTKVLFESGQQTYKDLTDCAYSMNRKITKGVISAIEEIRKNPETINFGDCFRDFNKYFNRYGAVATLDFFSEDKIKSIALNYMLQWQKEHTKKKDSND